MPSTRDMKYTDFFPAPEEAEEEEQDNLKDEERKLDREDEEGVLEGGDEKEADGDDDEDDDNLWVLLVLFCQACNESSKYKNKQMPKCIWLCHSFSHGEINSSLIIKFRISEKAWPEVRLINLCHVFQILILFNLHNSNKWLASIIL